MTTTKDTTKRAFGETLGFEVPTRYDAATHRLVLAAFMLDELTLPVVLGMRTTTVWLCRFLAGALFVLRSENAKIEVQGQDLTHRQRLEIEAGLGLLFILLAAQGAISRRLIDRAYLFGTGLSLLANSMMTEV